METIEESKRKAHIKYLLTPYEIYKGKVLNNREIDSLYNEFENIVCKNT